jgi:hypothetical protein
MNEWMNEWMNKNKEGYNSSEWLGSGDYKKVFSYRIWSSHSDSYEELYVLVYNVMCTVESQPTFRRSMSSQFPRPKYRTSKETSVKMKHAGKYRRTTVGHSVCTVHKTAVPTELYNGGNLCSIAMFSANVTSCRWMALVGQHVHFCFSLPNHCCQVTPCSGSNAVIIIIIIIIIILYYYLF